MEPKIVQLTTKKLAGKRLTTNFVRNRTIELWKSFMPQRHQIRNTLNQNLYSLQIYDSRYFKDFKPANDFEKWAAVEVASFDHLPEGIESFTLESGLYAVFLHKGRSTDTSTFHFIFSKWLPASPYLLDERPHFELLGEKYRNDDPDSEEEIWIPIKKKEDVIPTEELEQR